jgi:hypothetical protein
MAEAKNRRSSSGTEKTRDPRSIRKFLEELSWLLSSHSNLDFRAIRDFIESDRAPLFERKSSLSGYVSKNPNIHFLTGTLPVIFSDDRLFPSNEDIVEFSETALHLPIPRWEKRSRYELIGLIVCETSKLDNDRLERLVQALSKIVSDDPNAQRIFRTRKAAKLSWNEVIQKLTTP